MTTLLEDVLALHRRQFAVIPVPFRQKRPVLPAWQDLRLTEADLPTAFAHLSNVGILLGAPSDGLVDVDLDSCEARALAPFLLPLTGMRSGRASAPESHCFYRVTESFKTTKYLDPSGASGDHRAMLVEVRSSGAQTLVPPSVHPSGEPIIWVKGGEPAVVEADILQQAVAKLAAASLLARYWPARGSRHEAALALGGGLLRAGWDREDASNFVGHTAQAAGDEEAKDRGQAVRSTADALATGQHATGWPTLSAILNPQVVQTVRKWLGIRDTMDPVSGSREDAISGGPTTPFPVGAFPPVIATFIESGATAFGIPTDFIAIPLLSFAAGVIGNVRIIEVKPGWTERAILWTGVIGRPGSGKSPGMEYAQQLINGLQQRAWLAHQAELATWKTSQQDGKVVRVSAQARPEPPTLESFYTTDATIEAIAVLAEASPGVCLVRDELVGWVNAHDAYRRGGDRQAWLSLWAGSALKIDRKTAHPVFIPAPSISVTGGLQPDRLTDLRDAAGRDDGFVDRLLLGWPTAPATRWTDAVVDPAVVRAAQDLFALLRSHPDGTRRPVAVTTFEERARARFIAWHDANADLISGAHGLAAGWASKYPRQVARIALVLHALHHPDAPLRPVSVEIVDGAIAIIEYFRAHLAPILARLGQVGVDMGSAGHVSRVAALLREAGGRWVSRTGLHAGLGRNVPAHVLTAALGQLEDEGVAEQRQVSTEGRPREEWRWCTNEVTNKGPYQPETEGASFVSSLLREDEPDTCCICGEPLPQGRRYQCEGCAAEGVRRNAERFGEGSGS